MQRSIVVALLALGLACAPTNDTVDVPGPVRRFDPLAALSRVTAYASREGHPASLVMFKAIHVRSDGTIDLEASYHRETPVTYRFIRTSAAVPDLNVPIGARTPVQPFVEVRVEVQKPEDHDVQCSGGRGRCTWRHLGMDKHVFGRDKDESAPIPECGLAALWREARQNGAPADAVATIEYDKSGFSFQIPNTKVALRFDRGCRLQK